MVSSTEKKINKWGIHCQKKSKSVTIQLVMHTIKTSCVGGDDRLWV